MIYISIEISTWCVKCWNGIIISQWHTNCDFDDIFHMDLNITSYVCGGSILGLLNIDINEEKQTILLVNWIYVTSFMSFMDEIHTRSFYIAHVMCSRRYKNLTLK